jgi:hypothetical protein
LLALTAALWSAVASAQTVELDIGARAADAARTTLKNNEAFQYKEVHALHAYNFYKITGPLEYFLKISRGVACGDKLVAATNSYIRFSVS